MAVDDGATQPSYDPKPKRITNKTNVAEENVGKAIFLKDNKIRFVFIKGDSMVVDGPLTNSVYSPAEIFCVLKEQVHSKKENQIMKIISVDYGCGLVPVTWEGVRKAYWRYRKDGVYK